MAKVDTANSTPSSHEDNDANNRDIEKLETWFRSNEGDLINRLSKIESKGSKLNIDIPDTNLEVLTDQEAATHIEQLLVCAIEKRGRQKITAIALGGLDEKTTVHMRTLAAKHQRLVSQDDYGRVNYDKWFAEINIFINSTGVASIIQEAGLSNEQIMLRITNNVEKYINNQKTSSGTDFDLVDPIGFEHSCAEALRNAGWAARTTKRSGDQGVDVIAEKGGVTIVVQCKLWSQPVGNKAVQEIIAGKTYYRANLGVVVSNAAFTSSAKELARSCNVLLLHYSELNLIEERFCLPLHAVSA